MVQGAEHEKQKNHLRALLQQGNITLDEYKRQLKQLIEQTKDSAAWDKSTDPGISHPNLQKNPYQKPQTKPMPLEELHKEIEELPQTNSSHLSFDEIPLELPESSFHQHSSASLALSGPKSPAPRSNTKGTQITGSSQYPRSKTPPNSIFETRYRLEQQVSHQQQTDAISYLAQDLLLGEPCFLHIATPNTIKTTGSRNRFLAQYHQQRKIRHPQLAQVYHLEYQPTHKRLYVLMEYCAGTNLLHYIQTQEPAKALPFTAHNVGTFFTQLVQFIKDVREQTTSPIWFQPQDILWLPKHPERFPKILRIRRFRPHKEGETAHPVTPEDEILALGLLLRKMLMGQHAESERYPSQVNPTVSIALDEVLSKATQINPQDRYPNCFAMLKAYQTSLHFSPLIRSSSDSSVSFYAPASKGLAPLQTIQAHMRGILAVSTDQQGQTLLTAGRDHQLKWWDTRTWSAVYSNTIEDASLLHATLSPSGRLVAFTKSSHRIEVRYAGDVSSLCQLRLDSPIQTIKWNPSSSQLLTACKSGAIYRWEIPSGTLLSSWNREGSTAKSLSISPNGKMLASLHQEQGIHFWSLESNQWLFDLSGMTSPVRAMVFAPPKQDNLDSSILFTGHENGEIVAWDYQTGLKEYHIQMGQSAIYHLTICPHSKWLLSSDTTGKSNLIPIDQQMRLGTALTLDRQEKPLTSAHFFPNRSLFVTSTTDPYLTLWCPPQMDD